MLNVNLNETSGSGAEHRHGARAPDCQSKRRRCQFRKIGRVTRGCQARDIFIEFNQTPDVISDYAY